MSGFKSYLRIAYAFLIWSAAWLSAAAIARADAPITVVSAATLQPLVSPNSWAIINGSNLASSTQFGPATPGTNLGGVSVTVAGQDALVIYISPQTVDIVVPSTVPMGSQPVVLTNNGTTFTGNVNVGLVAPGVFQVQTLRRDRALASNPANGTTEPFTAQTAANATDDKRTRILIFGTGWESASNVAVQVKVIHGLLSIPLTVEQNTATGYPGLDTLQVIVPDTLTNAGIVSISVEADAAPNAKTFSNTVTVQMDEAAFDTANVPGYLIQTPAGTGAAGYAGDLGPAVTALLSNPAAVGLDRNHNIYIADSANHVIRMIVPGGVISTFAGTGTFGSAGDGGPAADAEFELPTGVAVDRLGDVYVADAGAHRIRMIDTQGNIHTVAGSGTPGFSGDGGPAVSAFLNNPAAVAADRFGNLFIADTGNHRVREITGGDLKIHTVAGTGVAGDSGDGGFGQAAQLDSPNSVAVDNEGTVYIADAVQLVVRAVDPDGTIRLIAGTGASGDTGDEGNPTAATFRGPLSLAVDRLARLWIADSGSHRARIVSLDNSIHAVAGTGSDGSDGDGGPALQARLHDPEGMAADPAGNVFIADEAGQRVRALTETANCSPAPVLSFVPQLVIGGQALTGYLRIACPLAADAAFSLNVSLSGVVAPSSVTVVKGETIATFPIATPAVTGTQTATVTANGPNGASVTSSFIVAPGQTQPNDPAPVVSVTVQDPTVIGGYALVGRVLLGAPAPVGGKPVTVTIDNSAASAPSAVTIPAGHLIADFLITTTPVLQATVVNVTGTTDGGSSTTSFTILPAGSGQILSLVITPSEVGGGDPATGVVTLASPAPAGGVSVFLSSNNPAATVPGGIVIPEGQTVGMFTVNTTTVTSTQSAIITAKSTNSVTAPLTIDSAINANDVPSLSSLTLNPSTVTGGQSSIGTVTLSNHAPSTGAVVILTSDHPGVSVPGSITIAAGQNTGTFTVTTSPVAAGETVQITATYNNSISAPLIVNATAPSQAQIAGISLNPASVTGGSPSTGTVTLSNPAPANGVVVTLGSNNGAATVPASITIAGGQTTGTFTVNTSPVNATQTPAITATSANTVSAPLTINPGGPTQGQIASVSLNPSTVTGGQPSTGTVTLIGPASAGGVLVTLGSNNGAAGVPASITIPSGQTSGTFPVSTSVVGSQQMATITATSANSASAVLTINTTPPSLGQITGLTLNPSTVTGGSPSTGTVTLASAAPVNGILVNLSSNNGSATVPASITVSAGQTVASFTVNTTAVGSQQVASITATSSNSASASLTIDPGSSGQGTIQSLTLNPTAVTGGGTSTGTVTLSSPAGVSGVLVTLGSGNPNASVPASIVIPNGQTTGTFTVNTSVVGSTQSANITATSANTASATLTINATPAGQGQIAGLNLNPSSVPGGSPSTGTVTLASPAPANGVLVTLGSNNGAATTPANITISGGQTTGTFTITTSVVGSQQSATITATSANAALAVLTITTTPPGQGQIASLTLNPASVPGGSPSTGTVMLASAAPANGVLVTLASNNGAATVPGSITIPGGQTSGTFTVSTSVVGSQQSALITATSANSANATLTITATPPGQGQIAGLVLNPSTVAGGSPSTGTVTLVNPAPVNGIHVTLGSNSGSATVPAFINIGAGLTTGTFTVNTAQVGSQQVATITATSANSANANLTITASAVCVQGLTLNASITNLLSGQGLLAGTVTLTGPAPQGGTTVQLLAGNVSLGNVLVPAGQTSAPVSLSVTNILALLGSVIKGVVNGCAAVTTTLSLGPGQPGPATIASLQLNPTSVAGGSPSTGTVTLTSPAPSNGALVALSSNNGAATVPGTITIPPGQTSGTFQVTTSSVASTQNATITATSSNSVNAGLTINPSTVCVQGLTLNASITNLLSGQGLITGTVTLTGPAPQGGTTVQLLAGNVNLGSVLVPAGQTSAPVSLSVANILTLLGSAIQGVVSGCSPVAVTLSLGSGQPGPVTLAGIALNPTSVTGGSPSIGTVTLASPAPSNGALIALTSNNAAAGVPSSITIPVGQTVGTFQVTTSGVSSPQNVTITATSANSVNASLAVNPAVCVQSLNLTASITNLLTGQGLLNGTVTLTGPAPAGGSTVQLASGNVNLGSVFVPAGQTSAPVSLSVNNIVTILGSTIQAVLNGCPLLNGTLTLASGQAAPAFLTSLGLNPTSLTGASGPVTGTVTINAPAGSNGVLVALQSSNPSAVTVPSTITIAPGQTSATFSMTTGAVSADTQVTITATSSNTLQATFNDKSPCVSGLTLSVKVTNLLTGQGLLSGAVNLTGPAPAGGSTVELVGLNTDVAVPQGSSTAPVSLTVANAVTLVGSAVTGVLGNCPGFPVTVQLGL